MALFGKKKKAAEEEFRQYSEQAQDAAAQYGYQGPQAQVQPGASPQQVAAAAGMSPADLQMMNAQGQQMAAQHAQAVAAGAAPGDPAILGGPSNAPLPADSPLWQPIEGVSLDTYAQVAKYAATYSITDEATIGAAAEQYWHIPAQSFLNATHGWIDRMRQSQAIGQRFRQVYDAS